MSSTIPSPDAHALTGAYLLDALTGDELAGFENHLRACPSCAADVAELGEAVGRLGTVAAAAPPPALKARVLYSVTRTRQLPPMLHALPDPVRREPGDEPVRRQPGPAPRTVSRRTVLSLVAAGVAAAAGAGVALDQHRASVFARRDRDELAAILAESDARTVRGAVDGGGRATVVMSRRRDSAMVMLNGLPALPAREVYQAWLIDGRRTARSAGLVDGSGSATMVLRGLTGIVRFGLTVEPEGGSARPTLPAAAMILMA